MSRVFSAKRFSRHQEENSSERAPKKRLSMSLGDVCKDPSGGMPKGPDVARSKKNYMLARVSSMILRTWAALAAISSAVPLVSRLPMP